MRNPYGEVLATPGAWGFVTAGFVGRIAMSMLGLGTVLLVSNVTGAYGIAGAVSATLSLAIAVAGPLLGRLMDRVGQAPVLLPSSVVHVAGLATLMACTVSQAPLWTLFGAAAVTGATFPSAGSLTRARWIHLLGGTPRLQTAFAFESVADEVVFVTGPALVTILATQVHPLAGLTMAGVFTLTGCVALALQRGTEPPPGGPTPARRPGLAIRLPGVLLLVAVFLGVGGALGSLELIMVAFAEEEGAPWAAGVIIGVHAGGSLIAGLAYGMRRWHTPLARRFLVGLAIFTAGMVPLAFVPSIPAMLMVVFVAGLGISPTIIPGFGLIERLVPAGQLTEGLTWVQTAITVGIAMMAPLAGQVVDVSGSGPAFFISLSVGVIALVVGLAGRRLLHGDRPAARVSR